MKSLILRSLSRLASDYGMVAVLALLCVYYSWVTCEQQTPVGKAAAEQAAEQVETLCGARPTVLILSRGTREDQEFAESLASLLAKQGAGVAGTVKEGPADARRQLEALNASGSKLDAIVGDRDAIAWPVFENLRQRFPALGTVQTIAPHSYWWPNFLKTDNLLNVANQITVIAVIAIGMTMVIITAGIDLSVGSLIALSAVVAAALIRGWAGGEHAGTWGMLVCSIGGMALCTLVGVFSGAMITLFGIPPFIVTLAMMLVASGMAYIISEGQSIYQVPDSYVWLGRGSDLLGIPNGVVLMFTLYAIAHLVMTRMSFGRYVYAVGGNAEAARLSGVPVQRVIVIVYAISGALAGLGGIIMASQLKSGSPTYGAMYELYVIAAVVVGGTSLSGGEGKVLATLIGAFIIAVIQNGMNLTGVESYTQKVVLGVVILGAVFLDMLKKRGWVTRLVSRKAIQRPVG
jgi:ribose transport system permease protein